MEKTEKSEAENLLKKLKESPTLVEMQRLHRWILKADLTELKSFFIYNGGYFLLNLMEIAQVCSLKTKFYAKQLEIFKIIQSIIELNEESFSKFMNIPRLIILNTLILIIFRF